MWAELESPDNADILAELRDEQFVNFTHSTRATYANGCRGPLCKKAERDRGRARWEAKQLAKGKTVQPRPITEAQERDLLLVKVIAWHRRVRTDPSANRHYKNMAEWRVDSIAV